MDAHAATKGFTSIFCSIFVFYFECILMKLAIKYNKKMISTFEMRFSKLIYYSHRNAQIIQNCSTYLQMIKYQLDYL